jgi:hypothetical protein
VHFPHLRFRKSKGRKQKPGRQGRGARKNNKKLRQRRKVKTTKE